MAKSRNFQRKAQGKTLSDVVITECPKEEIVGCSKVILDYTFRLHNGNEEAYMLASIGNWRGREFLAKLESVEAATAILNREAAIIRQYLNEMGIGKIPISCYYMRGGGDGKEALICENWPGN